jgi:hypothetical protein
MTPRSDRREVRNPVLALPAAQKLLALDPATREILAELLGDLAIDARGRAQESWRKNKGPMAAYWKAVGAYAGHIRRVCRMAPPARLAITA